VTRGSGVHDELGEHLELCVQCRLVNAEGVRIARPREQRHAVDAETLAALCPEGRSIYRAYLSWLAEPD